VATIGGKMCKQMTLSTQLKIANPAAGEFLR
jgi:hypothetical protein